MTHQIKLKKNEIKKHVNHFLRMFCKFLIQGNKEKKTIKRYKKMAK